MAFKQFHAIVFQNLLILCASAVLWKQSTQVLAATQVTRARGVSLASKFSQYSSTRFLFKLILIIFQRLLFTTQM